MAYCRSIDEIVLTYVISILEDLGDNSNAEENIDVDQFVEMMEAYIPGFSSINRWALYCTTTCITHEEGGGGASVRGDDGRIYTRVLLYKGSINR